MHRTGGARGKRDAEREFRNGAQVHKRTKDGGKREREFGGAAEE